MSVRAFGGNMAFTDRKLQCRDCPDEFVFTAGEQEFYASKGLELSAAAEII